MGSREELPDVGEGLGDALLRVVVLLMQSLAGKAVVWPCCSSSFVVPAGIKGSMCPCGTVISRSQGNTLKVTHQQVWFDVSHRWCWE